MVARANFDAIRSIAFGGISGAYANVGSPLTKPARGFCISNNTQGDMMFSLDGGTTDQIFVKAGNFKLYDIQSNMNAQVDDSYVLNIGTQFAVKQITAPVSGNVYIEVLST